MVLGMRARGGELSALKVIGVVVMVAMLGATRILARYVADVLEERTCVGENPPPQLRFVDVPRGALEDGMPRTELNIFEHRRGMAEYEAGYQAVLADEHEELQRELAEQEAAQHGTPKA